MRRVQFAAIFALSLGAPGVASPTPLRLPVEQRAHEVACRAAMKREIADLELTFEPTKARLDAQSVAAVAKLAGHLAQCSTMRLRLSADLDNTCDPAAGSRLARARAAAVGTAFAARGIPADRVEITDTSDGAGPGDPSCTPLPPPTPPPRPIPVPVGPDYGWLWWLIPAFLAGLLTGWLIWRRRDDPRREVVDRGGRAPLFTPPPAPHLGTAAKSGDADDVLRIKGVGPELKALLAGLGVTRLAQISRWTDADIAAVDPHLTGYHGRITRESWVAQARLLEAGAFAEYEHRFGKLQPGGD